MDEKSPISIIKALADGVNPITGEVLPEDSVYQSPHVIRALFAAVTALERCQKASSRKHELPGRAGSPWTHEEDERLVKDFESGSSIKELADGHQRTQGGIEARLVRLGRIAPEDRGKRSS